MTEQPDLKTIKRFLPFLTADECLPAVAQVRGFPTTIYIFRPICALCSRVVARLQRWSMSWHRVAAAYERDGTTYPGHRDPPGQSCVYIQPGDERRENYRLSTFSQFPETPVSPSELAESGFYYTGFRDRVRCFSCGLCVENWMLGDNPKEQRWHRTDCEFATGNDRTNIPLPRLFTAFIASVPRRNCHPSRQSEPVNQGPQQTTPQSREQQGAQSGDIPPNHSVGASHVHEPYPCRHPVNPLMRSLDRRLETFNPERGPRWPAHRTKAPASEIASAGFFYLGERDRVKCWYCNGGLQNWDFNDDPWMEHAKWFPSCEFVLRSKGYNFVQTIVSQFPNLNRPTPVRRDPSSVSVPSSNQLQSSVTNSNDRERNLENAILHFPFTTLGLEMGFTLESIREVLERKYNVQGSLHASSEDFIHDLIASQPPESAPLLEDPPRATEVKDLANNERSALSELRKLEEERLCKTCKRRKSDIVNIPCGHVASCSECSVDISRCAICGKKLQDKIKMFRA